MNHKSFMNQTNVISSDKNINKIYSSVYNNLVVCVYRD